MGGPSLRLGCFYGGTFVAAPCVIPRCPARPTSRRALLLRSPLSGPFSCAAAFPPVLLCSQGTARRAATRARGGVRRTRGASQRRRFSPPSSAALVVLVSGCARLVPLPLSSLPFLVRPGGGVVPLLAAAAVANSTAASASLAFPDVILGAARGELVYTPAFYVS